MAPPGQPGQRQQQLGHPENQPQPGFPYPPLQQPNRPMSTRGPKILTFVGGGVLTLAIVALVLAIIGLVSLVPTGIVDSRGEPGADSLLSLETTEPALLDSVGDVTYNLWEVTFGVSIMSPSDVEVTGPDGEDVLVRNPSVSSHSTVNGVQSRTFGEFSAAEPGAYLVTITPVGGARADGFERVIVSYAAGFEGFFADVLGTTALMIMGIGGGIVGFGLTIAGIIWWGVARNRNRRIAAQRGPATTHHPQPQPPTFPGPQK